MAVAHRQSTGVVDAGGDFPAVLPSPALAGSLLVWFGVSNSGSDVYDPPSGFTTLLRRTANQAETGGHSLGFFVAYKVAAGGEQSLTPARQVDSNGDSAIVAEYTGAAVPSAFAYRHYDVAFNDQNIALSAFTATSLGGAVLAWATVVTAGGGGTWTPPSGYAQRTALTNGNAAQALADKLYSSTSIAAATYLEQFGGGQRASIHLAIPDLVTTPYVPAVML